MASPDDAPRTTTMRPEPARLEDLPQVLALVDVAGLPLTGIPAHFSSFLVLRLDGRIVGAVGLELHGPDAVLRSLVVAPRMRRAGLGRELVKHVLLLARAHGVRTAYLLTMTAAEFFARESFEPCARESVPEAIASSTEFAAGVCPETSVCMRRSLEQASCCGGAANPRPTKLTTDGF